MSIIKLYRISQQEEQGYDTFDSAVVAAYSPEEASKIHPKGTIFPDDCHWEGYSWVNDPSKVKVERLGRAYFKVKAGDVICASFNAG